MATDIRQIIKNELLLKRGDHAVFTETYWEDTGSISPLKSVVSGHLFIESLINNILNELFRNPSAFSKYTFSQKVSLLEGVDLFPSEGIAKIKALNKIRNQFAHDLKYIPKKEDVFKISELINEEDWKIGHDAALQMAIAYLGGYVKNLADIIRKLKNDGEIKL